MRNTSRIWRTPDELKCREEWRLAMFTLEIFETFARYNRWMNEKLFAICAGMSGEERKRDLRAPFHSIHGTFNHLLLVDRLWLGRFQKNEFHIATLADELYSDFDELRRERNRTDDAIDAWIATIHESQLASAFTFHSRSRTVPRHGSDRGWGSDPARSCRSQKPCRQNQRPRPVDS